MKWSNKNKNLSKEKDTRSWKQKSLDGIIKAGSAFGNNRFLVAIRDSFMLPFSLTTGAAIPLILANLFFSSTSVITAIPGVKDSEGMMWVNLIIGQPLSDVFWAVMSGFSIYLCAGMGYFLAKSYGKDGIIAAALAIACYFALKPLENIAIVGTTDQTISTNYLGNNGILIALLSSMLATYVYVKLMNVKWLIPKLPDSVPPMVAKAFAAIFVCGIVILMFSMINQIWFIIATKAGVTGATDIIQADGTIIHQTRSLSTLFVALEFILSGPLQNLSQGIGTTILISLLVAFFWFFGIHGTNVLTPITSIIWDANVLKNTAYWSKFTQGVADGTIPNDASYWKYPIEIQGQLQYGLMAIPMAGLGYVGGTGATLGFLIGIFIFSKVKVHREIAKLAIVPGIFGINEPVNFGVPIVLNPIYFIPYVFGFCLVYTLGHVWILIHWIRPAVIWTPTMPYGLNIFFATAYDWWSLLVAVIQLALSFFVWLPFVWIGPKFEEKMAKAMEEKAQKKDNLSTTLESSKQLTEEKDN
ncbi:PTS transporter subunit EIIC [Spiroplasma sp. SV19]|uniref:PTS sugar transporter subunit IIC n=1 Tax=Spiroplasma sp. SV19 TaxID=2570468 RepID=UPI0024B6A733|nr:PTS transporter subunit EIIC [Spiroplasma sp. SV19]